MLPRGYLIGNLTADPVHGVTSASMDYSRFSIACSETYSGVNQSSKTHYYNCIAWGKRAQYISTYIKKGDSVFLEFTLLTNNYTNIEGRVIKRMDLHVDKIEMLYQRLGKSFAVDQMEISEDLKNKEILKEQEKVDKENAESENSQNENEDEPELELDEIFSS